jgi:molecular chaperone GrpE
MINEEKENASADKSGINCCCDEGECKCCYGSKCKCEDGKCGCEEQTGDCKCKCEDGKCECGDGKCKCICEKGKCVCTDGENGDCKECGPEEVEDATDSQDAQDLQGGDDTTIEKLQNDFEQEKGERLSLLAEFVNYKKRIELEKADLMIVANNILLKQIIEIVDDFDRAMKQIDSKNAKDVIEGVIMIQKKLTGLLDAYGLKVLDIKAGDEFSPQTMETVSSVLVKDHKQHNKVIEVLQKGYVLKDSGVTFKSAVVVIGKK